MTNSGKYNVIIEGQQIEYIKEYIYLGQAISFENLTEKEINRRIAVSWNKYWSYKQIMMSKDVSTKLKVKLYETTILPCLTYGCQTWALRKKDEYKLRIQQRKMERSMLGIRLADRISNEEIRKKTNMTDVVQRIRSLKWNWAGHICRMDGDRWTKRSIEWLPRDGQRKKGRPRLRWEDVFKQNVDHSG